MPNVLVSITASDLDVIKKITGETKNATALKEALSQWLDGRGEPSSLATGAGGYRPESACYWNGYNHGKTIVSPAMMESLVSDFEAWCQENAIEATASNHSSWLNGVRQGWFVQFQTITESVVNPDVTIYHLDRFFDVCQTNGIHNIEKADINKLQEIFLLSHPQYGE